MPSWVSSAVPGFPLVSRLVFFMPGSEVEGGFTIYNLQVDEFSPLWSLSGIPDTWEGKDVQEPAARPDLDVDWADAVGRLSMVEVAPFNWIRLQEAISRICLQETSTRSYPAAFIRYVAEQIRASGISYIVLKFLLDCLSKPRLPRSNSDGVFEPACFSPDQPDAET